jgi:CrcB protein
VTSTPRTSIRPLLPLIFIGGALGTVLRDELERIGSSSGAFPIGIFIANCVGSLLLGYVVGFISAKEVTSPARLRALIGTGFCGGLTTFSTLCAGTVGLAQSDHVQTALLYLATTAIAGLVAAGSGYLVPTFRTNHRRSSTKS